jgi:hypothetical protein
MVVEVVAVSEENQVSIDRSGPFHVALLFAAFVLHHFFAGEIEVGILGRRTSLVIHLYFLIFRVVLPGFYEVFLVLRVVERGRHYSDTRCVHRLDVWQGSEVEISLISKQDRKTNVFGELLVLIEDYGPEAIPMH